ncbi:MAG: bifunctional phosphopantothenoylcysteine decarboxylase/phosphopantothenate--cysteine ligase CoaBC [archaeon GB-1867-005]|nr:bifunctional phosphopantothenoylcysteine decarboxylase/phosphopantothenate--cysteine ligase CoaBC [Candidatus Culexmicrobium cathedralense]
MIHPSKEIIGTKSSFLKGRKIVLCICGSVAAIKSPEIARELMRHGAEVYPVMSKAATEIIHPYLMEWATGNPVVTKLTGNVEHVMLCGKTETRADLILIAPATANTISKIACGIDDTPVTTFISTALGTGIPIMIVPAMHETMYNNPFVSENIEKLKRLGVIFVGPRIEEGKAKIATVDQVVNAVIKFFTPKLLQNKRVLITAGPTREYLDDVKFLTTPSSGKMGIALAEECLAHGAKVTLILGPAQVQTPLEAKVIRVTSCSEMKDAVISELKRDNYDYIFLPAAPLDFTFSKKIDGKIPSELKNLTVELISTPKIAGEVRKYAPKSVIVGFKAEHGVPVEEMIERAYRRLIEHELDLIVANDVSRKDIGFGSDFNEVYIIDKNKKVIHIPRMSKREVAREIIKVALRYENKTYHKRP